MEHVPEFRLVANSDTAYFECIIGVRGGSVAIRLRPERTAFEESRPYAEEIWRDIEVFTKRLADFLATEARTSLLRPYREEISHLELESIDFNSVKPPDVAEVVFRETGSGRIWGCAYRAGGFLNLGFDD